MADALDTIEGVLHMGYERVGDEIMDKDNVYLDAADCRVLSAAFAEMAAELDADHGMRGGSDGCVPTTEDVRAMIAEPWSAPAARADDLTSIFANGRPETWEVISDALAKVALPIAEHRDALAARADAAEAEVERLRKAREGGAMADETNATTTERPTCEVCGKPEAVDADYDSTDDAAVLCWAEANGGHSPQNVIDALRTTRDALAAEVARLRADIEHFQRAASEAEQTRRDLVADHNTLAATVRRLEEREAHWSSVLCVADGGQYRADWDSRIRALVADRDVLAAEVARLREALADCCETAADTADRMAAERDALRPLAELGGLALAWGRALRECETATAAEMREAEEAEDMANDALATAATRMAEEEQKR